MPDEVFARQLRKHTAEVLRRVEAGETLHVTVYRRAVAELVPLASRVSWVPRRRAHAALVRADAGLRRDLDEGPSRPRRRAVRDADEAAASVVTLAGLELGVHLADTEAIRSRRPASNVVRV